MSSELSEKTKYIFESAPVPKALVTMAVPTVISQLIILIYNLADTFFIGRTGNPYMVAAASLILPVYNICISIANIAGTGGGSLISRLLGLYETEKAKIVSSFCIYFSLFSTAVFSFSMYTYMDGILNLLGASSDTFSYAESYAFYVIVIGGIPTVISMTLANLLRSVGFSKAAGFGVSMGGVCNIILDPLFMFVILPKGMEIKGAAVATMLSNLIVCIYFIVFIIVKKEKAIITLLPQKLPEINKVLDIFAVGIPAAVGTLLFDIAYIVIDKLATGYGDIPLAAIGIVLKAERFPLNCGVGLCLGMVPLLSYSFSKCDYIRLKKIVSVSRMTGIIIAFVSIVIYEIFAHQIMSIFIDNAETVKIGTSFLRARCLATPFMFICFHCVHFFQSVGKGIISLILVISRWAFFNIPLLFILEHFFGMYGIVFAQVTSDFIMALISLVLYYIYVKKHFSEKKS